MINRAEKLCLLSEMIAYAQTDANIKSIEYSFLFQVAKQLDISDSDLDYLFKHPIHYVNLKSHAERIVQFHRLLLLMDIERGASPKHIVKIYNFGLRMGLSHESIDRVLDLMNSFPNRNVPPDVLIDIFKVQYN